MATKKKPSLHAARVDVFGKLGIGEHFWYPYGNYSEAEMMLHRKTATNRALVINEGRERIMGVDDHVIKYNR
jgi:hypothetical protein